jgi:lipopolysaccharide/colanic/teichoic acid biosynthesis glycosyltransferase
MTMNYREITIQASEPVAAPLKAHTPARSGAYRAGGKRVFDLVLCLLAAPLALPLIAVLAFFVALGGGQPFYRQARIGRGGRTYRMWKMRSMVMDADDILEAHLAADPQARTEWNRDQKLKSDPRITRFGYLLRRSSMDELPQLWNVVLGEMSLVGPRPMMTSQKALYPGRDYYDLRPGITGSWQVSDRNASSFAERATYDAAYNKNLSLREDMRILRDTVSVVLRGTGC